MSDVQTYLVIEGPMGAGASSLAERISERLGYRTVLDPRDENPFLRRFHQDPARYALAAQLSYFRLRLKQQQEIAALLAAPAKGAGESESGDPVVADYLFARDELFARMTLTDEEYEIYDYFASSMNPDPPKPDLVIYLQAAAATLQRRIAHRGRQFESDIPLDYLQRLVEIYNQYFFHYKETPLLVINTTEMDYVNDEIELDYLIDEIRRTRAGTRYYVASVAKRT